MSSVIVQRGLADRPGPDIVAPLLVSDRVRVARGRAEIDRNCSNRTMVSAQGRYIGWLDPGSLVNVNNAERGNWRGVVDSCELSFSLSGDGTFTADTNLVIEKEA